MNVLGSRALRPPPQLRAPAYKDWANRVALNPARIPPDHPGSAALDDALRRLQQHTPTGVSRLAELGGLA